MSKFFQFPSRNQWKQFFSVLTHLEKILFLLFFFLAIGSSVYLSYKFYLNSTIVQPDFGGNFNEVVIGQPRFINPLYLANNDIDRDLVELLFSGLMKYNEKGELINDLAESYEIKEDGKIWEVELKKNVFWSDSKPLTVDDVIFTIKLIQNPEYKSPLRIKWIGIEVEKISDKKLQFKLKKGAVGFLENLTLKIIPKHIFENIPSGNFPWILTSKEYLEKSLIGSGPYKIEKISQDSKSGYIKYLILKRNPKYFAQPPFISQINFLFFEKKEDLVKASLKGKIDGFLVTDPKDIKNFSQKNLKPIELSLPRYFAIFFNLSNSNSILAKKEIREALAYAINKKEILEEIFSNKGEVAQSPILPEFYNYSPPSKIYEFNKEKAKEILEQAGFKYIDDSGIRKKVIPKSSFLFQKDLELGAKGEEVKELQKCLETEISGYFGQKTKEAVIRFQEKYKNEILEPNKLKKGTGKVGAATRQKLNQICFADSSANAETISLEFSLITSDNSPLKEIAEELQKAWKDIGISALIILKPISILETEIIESRKFETLLFAEVLSAVCDPLSFWHSALSESPGLNLTGYKNKEADKLLEEIRTIFDEKERKEKLEKFQNILIEDLPAIFLINPDLIYFVSEKVKGLEAKKIIEPAKRFSGIENWYIKTKRVWK